MMGLAVLGCGLVSCSANLETSSSIVPVESGAAGSSQPEAVSGAADLAATPAADPANTTNIDTSTLAAQAPQS
ncbi:MAG: hypothetical protein ACOYME_14050, partial [Prochlorotrichaceae cyanobacterium]